MGRGRKLPVWKLMDEDCETLRDRSGRRKTAQGLALRSRIVGRAAEDGSAAGLSGALTRSMRGARMERLRATAARRP
jgi:hypothetical protein